MGGSGSSSAGFASGRRFGDQSAFGPRMASTAGTSVMATVMPMKTAIAIPGPNARNAGDPATMSAPVPAAAVNPAVAMIGVNRAAACTAASRRSTPAASWPRAEDRKKTT